MSDEENYDGWLVWARVKDLTGQQDGLNGVIIAVVTFPSVEAMLASVGAEHAWEFVAVNYHVDDRGLVFTDFDSTDIMGWKVEDGAIIKPAG